MRTRPPEKLVALLSELQLASPAQFAHARRRVRRLAGGAAIFDSVWIDALVQNRALTLFQGAAIMRGEAHRLRFGSLVLIEPSCLLGSINAYRARDVETGDKFRVLTVDVPIEKLAAIAARLERLVQHAEQLSAPGLRPITRSGTYSAGVWAAHERVAGLDAATWTTRHGRLAPEAALAIARNMASSLELVEAATLTHGDLSPRELVITPEGNAVITAPGFRAAVGYDDSPAGPQLTPAAFDSYAPESIARAGRHDTLADRFALGVVWWHLLAGRSPWPAGNQTLRLQAILRARLPNIRYIAPDTPPALATAIEACTQSDPRERPASYRKVYEMLGDAAPSRRTFYRAAIGSRRPTVNWQLLRGWRPVRHSAIGLAGLAACLLFLTLLLRPVPVEQEVAIPPAWRQPVVVATKPAVPSASTATPAKIAVDSAGTAAAEIAGTLSSPAFRPGASPAAAVNYHASSDANWDSRVERAGGTPELILPTDRPLRLASLRLVPGQVVRGAAGKRVQISAPRDGLAIDVEDVRFVDVDFVAEQRAPNAAAAARRSVAPCLLRVSALNIAFDRCTFAGGREPASTAKSDKPRTTADAGWAAIEWRANAAADPTSLALSQGRLAIENCALIDINAAIRIVGGGSQAIAIDNTLHLGPGPLLQWDRCPRLDEPLHLALSHVTLRDAAALAEICYAELPMEPGRISIVANDCVLAPHPAGSLLHFAGSAPPARIIGSIDWTGQGSVIVPQGVLAAWRGPSGRSTPLEPKRWRMAGLVTSEVGFAADAGTSIAASRAVRWQVPLRSADPPGIDESRLPPGFSRPDSGPN